MRPPYGAADDRGMSRLIDPRICPDCRAALDPAGTCTGCALRLTGPLAAELWRTMQVADTLVERLRVEGTTPVTVGATPVAPPLPLQSPRRAARGLSAGSVPAVLFGIGALCLLVAAVVFVAVAWSSLGLGARTSILLAVTGTFGVLASRLTLRGLRGAAETFWLVVGALVVIDLVAGYAAGLLGFDALDGRHAVAVLGASLLALGLGVGAWALRTELPQLVAPTLFSTLGSVSLVASEGWAAPHPAVGTTAAILALVALAVLARRAGLRTTAYAVSGLAVVSWVVLVGSGLDRAGEASVSDWWTGPACWPLVAAVLLAGAAAHAGRLPEELRTGAATAAELALVLLVVAPGGSADRDLVLLSCLAVGFAGACLVAPRTWALPAVGYAGVGALVAAGFLLLRPAQALVGLPTTGPSDSANLDLHLSPPASALSPWTAIVLGAVVVVVALALVRWIGDPALRHSAVRVWVLAAPTVGALGVVTAFLETGPTVGNAVLAWTAVLALLAILAATARPAPAPAALAITGYLGVVGLRLAVPSHLLAALLATALATGLAVAYRRTGADAVTRATTGVAALVAAGFAVTHFPYLVGGAGDAAGLSLAALAAAAGLSAAVVARGEDRPVLEVTALVLGLGAVAFPVDDAVTTLVLTVVGSAVALVSVLHRDRDQVAWLGTAILGFAALLRVLGELSLPELATAPAAALLLVAGVHRMLTDQKASSLRVLGSGLTLALLPTLLLSIEDPVSLRGALAGVAAVLVLAGGIARRWAAPFLAGAGALAVLAVRHLGPVAEALPRWISLGALGVGLLVVAVTWEARRRQLEVAERYLVALR
jgi:hypothetical protein